MRNAASRNRPGSLAALRKQLGLSQQLLALYLGTTRSTVKMAESGHRTLPTCALLKLAGLWLDPAGFQTVYKGMHRAELQDPFFTKKCNHLLAAQSTCRQQRQKLETELAETTRAYQAARHRLVFIESGISRAGNNAASLKGWQQQQEAAARALQQCSQPYQLLLKYRIWFLKQQEALYKEFKLQLKRALPAFFEDGKPPVQ